MEVSCIRQAVETLSDSHRASRKAEEAGSLSLYLSVRSIPRMAEEFGVQTSWYLILCHCLAAARRFQAVAWLRSTLGASLKLSPQPSEEEFLSCLRNGLVLCNAINKIKPGAVPKVSCLVLIFSSVSFSFSLLSLYAGRCMFLVNVRISVFDFLLY